MARKLWTILSLALFIVGSGALALTLWLWFGRWPNETLRPALAYQRSQRENADRAPDPLIENVRGRRTTPLSGTWQAVIDLYGRGEAGGQAPLAMEPRTPSDLAEFSFRGGLTLEVPGDWNTQDPRLVFYQGVVWYKRTFPFRPRAGERTFLWFGAANYAAWVYLNGRLLGVHEGGFTPFNFDVTEELVEGENLLVVKVDNRMAPDDVPTALTDWHNYGGLTRDVLLVHVADTFARSSGIWLADDGRLEGAVIFDGPEPPERVRVALPELGVEAWPAVENGRASFSLAARPERWSPARPRLYRVEIGEGDALLADDVGFRSVAVRGREILLNGEPIFLKGISIHEEALGGGGRIRGARDAAPVLELARELGCNFVRLAHYTHDESMLRLADRMGLVVWAEIPVYWNLRFEDALTLDRAKRQLSEMIARDRNRASVVFWSVGNETPQAPGRLAFMTALVEHVRREDPTRLVTAALITGRESLLPLLTRSYLPALLGLRRSQWRFPVNDPLADVVDVVAVNEYFGWYYSGGIALMTPLSSHTARRVMLDNLDRIRIETGVEKPLIVSETGAGARYGLRAPREALHVFSEEYQALVYERQLAMLDRQPDLAGLSPWLLVDFRSPMRLYQGVQDHWNRKGLVDPEGRRKLAFDVLRAWYAKRS